MTSSGSIAADAAELMLIASREETTHRMVIGHAGVFVADGRGKEFQESTGGVIACVGE
jgi:hypothetical protein